MEYNIKAIELSIDDKEYEFIKKLGTAYIEIGNVEKIDDFYKDLFLGGLVAYLKQLFTDDPTLNETDWVTWRRVLEIMVHGSDNWLEELRKASMDVKEKSMKTPMFG